MNNSYSTLEISTRIRAYRKNLNFRNAIIGSFTFNEEWEWDTTTKFYTVLHLIDALLVKLNTKRPKTHRERNNALKELAKKDKKYKNLNDEYKKLYSLSKSARYHPENFTETDRDFANDSFDELLIELKEFKIIK